MRMSTGSGGVPVDALVLSSIPHRRSGIVQAAELQRQFHETGLAKVVAHAKQAVHGREHTAHGTSTCNSTTSTRTSTRTSASSGRDNRAANTNRSGRAYTRRRIRRSASHTAAPTAHGSATSASIDSFPRQAAATAEVRQQRRQQQLISIPPVPTVYGAVTASRASMLTIGGHFGGCAASSAKRQSDGPTSDSHAKRAHTASVEQTCTAAASLNAGTRRARQDQCAGNVGARDDQYEDDDDDDDDEDDDEDGNEDGDDDGGGGGGNGTARDGNHVDGGVAAPGRGVQQRDANCRQRRRSERRPAGSRPEHTSPPRSPQPASTALNPVLLRCSDVPDGFADERFVYDLPETIDLAMVKQATSHHPRRLRQPVSVGKVGREGPDMPAVPGDEALLTFAIFHPQRFKLQQLLVCTASQSLADLRRAISCWCDGLSLDPALKAHAFFYMEGTFFDATGSHEPSAHIRQWAQDKVARPFSHVSGLGQIRLRDLRLRLFAPYAFVHCVCCEHRIVLTQMRMKSNTDPSPWSQYPLTLFQRRPKVRKCHICHSFPATRVTLNDPMAPEAPCLFCDECFTAGTRHEPAAPPPARVVERYWHDP